MSGNNDTRQAPADEGQSRKNDWNADPARLQSIKEHGEPKTVGIIGSRRRKSKADYHQLHDALRAIYNDDDIIVSGGCPQGGDFFAEGIARRLGATIIIHHANWEKYGRSAGFKRNGKIALDADILVALVADDRRGGTEDTIRKYLDLCKGNLIILETPGQLSKGSIEDIGVMSQLERMGASDRPAPEPEEAHAQEPTPPRAGATEEERNNMRKMAHEFQCGHPERNGACVGGYCEEAIPFRCCPHLQASAPENTPPQCPANAQCNDFPTCETCIDAAPEPEPTPPAVVVNIKQPYDVYIGRRGHGQDGYFGNPHPVGKPCRHCNGATHTREEAIEAFREDFEKRITDDDEYRQRILDLAGKKLGCFCAPRPCHGDVIAEYLNQVSA